MVRHCSKVWYKHMLCLPSEGFVPSKTRSHLYSKKECRERLGASNWYGRYPWRHRGGPAFIGYVMELFERVYQKKLYESDMLPWHFARRLLAQEDSVKVDWAQYAVAHRRVGSRDTLQRLMDKYRHLRKPLPFTNPFAAPRSQHSTETLFDRPPPPPLTRY
ncbi:hypothetical protein M758_UG290500 [Ceratodon purpureus]|nr:hypothetical protein M758_UG290500 [Ceratodon purpureus]